MYKLLGGDGKEYGPIPAETLKQWIAEGRAGAQTKVLAEGATEWCTVQQLPEFSGAFLAPPPLPQKPPSESGLNQIIPYRNGPALAAYYCGVFSLIPCLGLLLGIVAFVLGVVGLRKLRSQPACGGKVHAWVGIVLGGLCATANLAIIVLIIVSR
jgi:hypothetical protein